MSKSPIIAVDFDGTITLHEFPKIGPACPGVFKWLKEFQRLGARLILWTMRSDGPDEDRRVLSEAVAFCKENGVEFWGVNSNPQQHSWTCSSKQYAHLYIDDAAFGCPLVKPEESYRRPYVDWDVVGPAVVEYIKAWN